MVAALIAHTDVGFPISNDAASDGVAVHEGVYAATIVTTLDWVILSDFTEIKYAKAYVTATGVEATAYVDGTTKNKVFVTATGAVTILAKGIKA